MKICLRLIMEIRVLSNLLSLGANQGFIVRDSVILMKRSFAGHGRIGKIVKYSIVSMVAKCSLLFVG